MHMHCTATLRTACILATAAAVRGFTFLSIGDWGDPAAKELNPWMGKTDPEFVPGRC